MPAVTLRFYAQLNDFLAYRRRQVAFRHEFDGNPAVKDTIEALGVPHTEVALILANDEAVGFEYHLQDGDRISVYPAFGEIELPEAMRVRAEAGAARFVADVHLGRLAAYLRMLGFDTLYPDGLPGRGTGTHRQRGRSHPALARPGSAQAANRAARLRRARRRSLGSARRGDQALRPIRRDWAGSTLRELQRRARSGGQSRGLRSTARQDARALRCVPALHRLRQTLLARLALRADRSASWKNCWLSGSGAQRAAPLQVELVQSGRTHTEHV